MSKRINLTGRKVGKLTVIEPTKSRIARSGVKRARWKCVCECGQETAVDAGNLLSRGTKSCGCATQPNFRNEAGNTYGRLTVISRVSNSDSGAATWICKCECGNSATVRGDGLRNGHHRSCGCLMRERLLEAATKHGLSRGGKTHPLYSKWMSMKDRCMNPNNKHYSDYGGRGIRIHEPWIKDPALFVTWITENLGECPEKHSLDRIDVNGNYEPGNLRWATAKEQSRNQRANYQVSPEFYSLLTEPLVFEYSEGTDCLSD